MLKIMLSVLLFSGMAYGAENVGFSNQSEIGYVVTGGNSESETSSIKQTNKYQWNKDSLTFTGHYIQASGLADAPTPTEPNRQINQTTAENWSARVRFDKIITPKWFTIFASHGWRGDRFQGVSNGHDSDIGAKYYTANSETYKQFFELGYRYTREFFNRDSGPNNDQASNCVLAQTPLSTDQVVGTGNCGYPEFHYVRLYGQIDYAYSKAFSMGMWVEYLPSVVLFSKDQRINFSPYIQSVLTDIFSLKVSYESRYRFEPVVQGNKLVDYTFTTALLAKF